MAKLLVQTKREVVCKMRDARDNFRCTLNTWRIRRFQIALAIFSIFAADSWGQTSPQKNISIPAIKAPAPKAAVEPLDIQLVRSKIVMVEGKESRQLATVAKPGEILEDVATYTNKSAATLIRIISRATC